MRIDKAKIKRIMVISLSNIGDAVLTTPVIHTLRNQFPQGHLAVLVGPRAFGVFKNDRRIDKKIIYDKRITWKNKLALVNRLKQERYDLVVDLRNSFFSMLLGARYRTSFLRHPPVSLRHMKDRHLWKLHSLGVEIDWTLPPSVLFSEEDEEKIEAMFKKWQINNDRPLIAIAPGARNMTKRWEKQEVKKLIKCLHNETKAKIIMVGGVRDELLVKDIILHLKPAPFDASGKTSISQLACLLSRCSLMVSCDSAPMHLGWAAGIPVVSIFGPTNYKKYAPLGANDIALYKDLSCSACEKSLCPKGTRECIKMISAEDVFSACKRILDEKNTNYPH